jgi:hypothetical protein
MTRQAETPERKLLAKIREAARGELQVADDDSEALEWIAKEIDALLGDVDPTPWCHRG